MTSEFRLMTYESTYSDWCSCEAPHDSDSDGAGAPQSPSGRVLMAYFALGWRHG